MFKCLIVKNSNYFSDIFRKNKNISLFTSAVKMSSSSNNDKSPSPPKKDEADDKKDKKPSSDNESEPDIDSLMNIFKMIGLKGKTKKREKVLKELDLENFAEHLKKSKKIIFMNGAGISTAAGIPDFRSPKTGLYSNLAKYDLPDPHLIFELNFFMQNPKPFFSLSKELMPKNYKPTKAHYFQRLLVDKGIVHKIYTQNIDGLESIARVPDNKVVYAHGSFKTGHCLACRKEYSFEWMKKNIHEKEFMKCESEECEKSSKREALKVVKPDIVFFGEQMPEEFHNFPSDFSECDCLVVIGTSLKVYPFSSLVDYVKDDCPRLLINRELVGDWQTYEDEPSANYRDVSFQGNCDDGCDKLAELCGWKDDLEKLIKTEEEKTPNPTA